MISQEQNDLFESYGLHNSNTVWEELDDCVGGFNEHNMSCWINLAELDEQIPTDIMVDLHIKIEKLSKAARDIIDFILEADRITTRKMVGLRKVRIQLKKHGFRDREIRKGFNEIKRIFD